MIAAQHPYHHCFGSHGSCEARTDGPCDCACGLCLKEKGVLAKDVPICIGDCWNIPGCYKPLEAHPDIEGTCTCDAPSPTAPSAEDPTEDPTPAEDPTP